MKKLSRRISKKAEFLDRQFLLPIFLDSVIFPADWSFEEVLDLHEHLLEDSLSILASAGNTKTAIKNKLEVLEWVFKPDIEHIYDKNDGWSKVDNTLRPLTFHVCCKVMSIDPESLRKELYERLEERYQKVIASEEKLAA